MPKYKFSEIAENVTEKRMPTAEDKLLYIAPNNLDTDTLSVPEYGHKVDLKGVKLVMHAGDMLFGRREPQLKKAAIAPHDGLFSAHGMIFHPKENVITKEFFPFFISSDYFFDAAIRIAVGSLSPTINWRDLKDLEFTIPAIDTQKKYSEILWSIITTKRAYIRLLQCTDALVKAHFRELFGQETAGMDFLPLEKCCDRITGGGTPSMKHPEYYGGSIPFIKSGDVKEHTVSQGALSLTETALEQTTAKLLPAGTVVVVIRSAALRHEFHAAVTQVPLVINQDLKALQVKAKFLPEYIMWALISNEEKLLGGVQTVLTSHIEMRDLLNLPIAVVPIEKQQVFCEFVNQSDKSTESLREALAKTNELQKMLVAEIFSGEEQ